MRNAEEILRIRDLNLYNREGKKLVSGVDLTLNRGEILGLVGESGSGKTLTLRALIGLLPEGISKEAGEWTVLGNCSMIFQNPMEALDPLCPVFRQLCEVIRFRQQVNKEEAALRARMLLKRLSLPEELAVSDRYPWELSGGQCQRLLIALALSCQPDLLLCDEPTTALDVTVQKQTLELLKELQRENSFAILFVTHNLAVAANLCSRLMVMQRGKVIESGPAGQILEAPAKEETKLLLKSILTIPEQKR